MARYQFSEYAELRAVAHVDMDCFYVQVAQRRSPELKGKPTAVVQYNPWRGGGLIAVGYEARAKGVKKQMRGDDARAACPEINLVTVPTAHGKADLTIFREAGAEVVSILSRKGICERASIDEVYLDLTEAAKERMSQMPESRDDVSPEAQKSHILGNVEETADTAAWLLSRSEYCEQLLSAAALIVAELRAAVAAETEFSCSAGIAHNKMLAKLASNMHKPAQQTVVPLAAIPELYEELPLKKLRQLGGKLGASLEQQLGLKTAGDLMRVPLEKLQNLHGKNVGLWLYRISRGLDDDPVKDRVLPKSHGCSKTFPGRNALADLPSVRKWVAELAQELDERLEMDCEQNGRFAKLLVAQVSYNTDTKPTQSASKSCPIVYGADRIAADGFGLVKRVLSDLNAFWVTGMGLSATNINATPEKTASITSFLTAGSGRKKADVAEEGEVAGAGREKGEAKEVGGGSAREDPGGELGRTPEVEAVDGAEVSQTVGRVAERGPNEASKNVERRIRRQKGKGNPLQAWLANAADRLGRTSKNEERPDSRTETGATGEAAHCVSSVHKVGVEKPVENGGLQAGTAGVQSVRSEDLKTEVDRERTTDGVACQTGLGSGTELMTEYGDGDVQLTLEEWIPGRETNGLQIDGRESTDQQGAAADLGVALHAQTGAWRGTPGDENQVLGLSNSTGAVEDGKRVTGLEGTQEPADIAGRGLQAVVDGQNDGRVLVEPARGSSPNLEASVSHERVALGTASRVPKQVEAPKGLEALWQKATVPKGDSNAHCRVEKSAASSRKERSSMSSRKRSSEGKPSDAREKLQKLWSKASQNESAVTGQAHSFDFDWQEVDNRTLEELPEAIQVEIRTAQRLQLQRQHPLGSHKKERHAQNIEAFLRGKGTK